METINQLLGKFTKKQYIMIFLPLSIVMLVACIYFNINTQKARPDIDYIEVSVNVADVDKIVVKSNGATINKVYVEVNYNGESYQMSVSEFEYDAYKNKIGQNVTAYFSKDQEMYSNPNNIMTSSGTIYFFFLGLEVLCLGMLIYGLCIKSEKKERLEK